MNDGSLAPILVALIGALGLILVALIPLVVSTRKHAKGANEAVNQKDPSEPRIADVVDAIAVQIEGLTTDVGRLAKSHTRTRSDVREIRKEQAAVAVALGQHLSAVDELERVASDPG